MPHGCAGSTSSAARPSNRNVERLLTPVCTCALRCGDGRRLHAGGANAHHPASSPRGGRSHERSPFLRALCSAALLILFAGPAGAWLVASRLRGSGHGTTLFFTQARVVVPVAHPLGIELARSERGNVLGGKVKILGRGARPSRSETPGQVDCILRVNRVVEVREDRSDQASREVLLAGKAASKGAAGYEGERPTAEIGLVHGGVAKKFLGDFMELLAHKMDALRALVFGFTNAGWRLQRFQRFRSELRREHRVDARAQAAVSSWCPSTASSSITSFSAGSSILPARATALTLRARPARLPTKAPLLNTPNTMAGRTGLHRR